MLTCLGRRSPFGSGSGRGLGPDDTKLKRKRPPRLEVAVAPALETAAAWSLMAAERRAVEEEGDVYSVYSKGGRRGLMEDRYCAVVDRGGVHRQAFFGVFDGHGGSKAAEYAAKNLDKNIIEELSSACEEGSMERAIRNGYLKTDTEFLKEGESGGTCCVTALIQKGRLVVSNAGDCRAVLSRSGVAEALTSDQRPSREDEQKRIEALGAYVDCFNGVWRVQGALAVSRGIGDRCLKPWVTAEPETNVVRIEPEFEFLILASDGLWDKVTNQEAVDMVRSLSTGVGKSEPLLACKKLAELSSTRGCLDDITVMLIQLGRFTK